MKALELLRMYQYADNCLNGLMGTELKEAIAELEELQLVTDYLVFIWDETGKNIEAIRAYKIPNEIIIDKSKDYEILIREVRK